MKVRKRKIMTTYESDYAPVEPFGMEFIEELAQEKKLKIELKKMAIEKKRQRKLKRQQKRDRKKDLAEPKARKRREAMQAQLFLM